MNTAWQTSIYSFLAFGIATIQLKSGLNLSFVDWQFIPAWPGLTAGSRTANTSNLCQVDRLCQNIYRIFNRLTFRVKNFFYTQITVLHIWLTHCETQRHAYERHIRPDKGQLLIMLASAHQPAVLAFISVMLHDLTCSGTSSSVITSTDSF